MLGVPLGEERGASLALSVDDPGAPRELIEAVVRTAAAVFEAASVSDRARGHEDRRAALRRRVGSCRARRSRSASPGRPRDRWCDRRGRRPEAIPNCARDPRFAGDVAGEIGYMPVTMLVAPLRGSPAASAPSRSSIGATATSTTPETCHADGVCGAGGSRAGVRQSDRWKAGAARPTPGQRCQRSPARSIVKLLSVGTARGSVCRNGCFGARRKAADHRHVRRPVAVRRRRVQPRRRNRRSRGRWRRQQGRGRSVRARLRGARDRDRQRRLAHVAMGLGGVHGAGSSSG